MRYYLAGYHSNYHIGLSVQSFSPPPAPQTAPSSQPCFFIAKGEEIHPKKTAQSCPAVQWDMLSSQSTLVLRGNYKAQGYLQKACVQQWDVY